MNENNNQINLGRRIQQTASTKRKINRQFVESRLNILSELIDYQKRGLVSRLFWGRGNFYKKLFHFLMISITLVFAVTGVVSKLNSLSGSVSDAILVGNNSFGTDDLLQQGGSINTVLLENANGAALQVFHYTVKEGDKLDDIAENYKLNTSTIKSANAKKYPSLFLGDSLETGWVLDIPEINGVFHDVNPGETIDSIISRYASEGNTEANKFNVVEFNNLVEPYTLEEGQRLFIPDGNISRLSQDVDLDLSQLKGAFVDPLTHPNCKGYNYSRGFTSYHNGVDLAKWDGCPIVAVADGYVEYAGWAEQGQGYMVRINHGGGVKTEYFHGNGTYWVKAGDVVNQGDSIMHMGTTGYSTGTHLHFILWKDRVAIDPAPYVPYNKPGYIQ